MTSRTLYLSVLGPVRAWRERAELELGPPKQRLTLAVLLLNIGRFVSAEEFLDALWGEAPPKSAVNAVRVYVHSIRRLLTSLGHPATIRSICGGYELTGQAHRLDLTEFEHFTTMAEQARDLGDRAAAVEHTRNGLNLWRGRPLAGSLGTWAQKQRYRLEQFRLNTIEAHTVDLLQLGRPEAAVSTIGGVVSDHPYDERVRELLMLALHRSGRTVEALGMYRETRLLFADELGIDLGAPLQRLHQHMLDGTDPTGW